MNRILLFALVSLGPLWNSCHAGLGEFGAAQPDVLWRDRETGAVVLWAQWIRNNATARSRSLPRDFGSPDGPVTTGDCAFAVTAHVTFRADVEDLGAIVTSVQFSMDGVDLGPALTTPPFTLTWDSSTVTNGCHLLMATATDNNGQTGRATRGITVTN